MEEDLTTPKNINISVIEDEKDKVKEFVYKHFKEVTDGSLYCSTEESPIKEHVGPYNEKQTFRKAHCKIQQGAVFSGKILSFGCSVCKDDITYSPNDLLKHFRAVHQGTLPTYPCELCGFVTNEFPALQRHRIEHRNTLVTCEICNDDVQYTLLLLTRHYIMCHSQNGQFHCERCEFTTLDAGTFVQHIHHHNESSLKCSKCRHVSLNHEEYQKHIKAHSGGFPFTCQICGFGAARSEYIKKHMVVVHNEEMEIRSAWKALEDNGCPTNPSEGLKLLLKKSPSVGGESHEAQRITKLNCLPGNLPNKNGRLTKPEMSLAETQQIDGTVVKKDKNWSKSSHMNEQPVLVSPASLMSQENDSSSSSDSVSHTNSNGLTVLMVKNKISLPPNCTTKVMGFKMVDGKKHLVLKVIPTAKQESLTSSSAEDLGSSPSKENGEGSDIKSSRSHYFPLSQRSGSHMQTDQDNIVAVKIKIEEEETCISNPYSTVENDVGEEAELSLNKSVTCEETSHPESNACDHMDEQSHDNITNCSEKSKFDKNGVSAACNTNAATHTCHPAALTVQHNWAADHFLAADIVADINKHKESSSLNTMENDDQYSQNTPKETDYSTVDKNHQRNAEKLLTISPESPSAASGNHRETVTYTENCTQNSPNQEVFTFHNYSKETFSISPNTTQSFDNMSESSTDKESICGQDSSHFSLTLAESPEPFREDENNDDSTQEDDVRKVSDSDIEVDECIASVEYPPTDDENPESVLQDFNIIKVEEENIPISKKQPDTKSSSSGSLGNFVEEHSDAIITQQLNKERAQSLVVSSDSIKPTKTTVRILQLPEGKQPVLLKTPENQYSMPVHLKAAPGFKLIANSTNPQINVSYVKPGFEKSSNPAAVVSTPNHRICLSAPKAGPCEQGATLLSPIQAGVSTTSNHYLINSTGLKGPVLLSSTSHCTPVDKTVKTQPTCYLLQRSVPVVQTPSTPGIKLASSQLPLNSRPVLAMPVSSPDKPTTLQAGRQAFLLRYISPAKSGILLNNQEGKVVTPCSQTGDSTANKVIFKIVTPSSGLLTSGAPTSGNQPLFLATRPQTQCFLVSSNKTNANASSGIKKLITIQNTAQKCIKESLILPAQPNVKVQSEGEKPILAPRPIRPPSQRKRRRKRLFDELPVSMHKARRLTNKTQAEKETTLLWQPVAKEVERTLRLAPFSSLQQIKCPRRYQPVVVLNHPDADIPEVTNIMKVVHRYRGAVNKVSLSQKTVQALSELSAQGRKSLNKGFLSHNDDPRPRPLQSSVRERFLLKLKLKKKSKKKYEVVETLSGCTQEPLAFDCWFCGRHFSSQEDWIGHGQRHLMEATRDWNKLF